MAKKGFTMPTTKSILDSIAGRSDDMPNEETPVESQTSATTIEPEPMDMAKEGKKNRNTTGFYLAPDIVEKLDACAMMQRKSRSEVCRIALIDYFARHQDLLDKYERFKQL